MEFEIEDLFSLHDEPEPNEELPPELALVCAMLERAVLDVQLLNKRNRREALAWLRSENTDLYSFVWCCEQLQVPDLKRKVREKIFQDDYEL